MLNNINSIKKMNTLISLVLILNFCTNTLGQQRPYQLQSNPRQMVAFSKNTDFGDAINILGKMAIQFEGKTIVDQTGQNGPIDIDIPSMHWKMALNRILIQRGLKYVEYPNYYQAVSSADNQIQNELLMQNMPYSLETREVKINAIFFQADRVKLKNAGIDWNILQSSSGLSLKTLKLGANFGITSNNSEDDGDIISGNPTGRMITSQTSDEDGSVDVNALLNLFESNDLGKVLSKPSIKVVDGVQGQIHVGTKFAITQRDFSGNTLTEFKDAGTILKVTPQIIEDSSLTFIHLKITAEKSSAKQGLGDKPEISTQKAQTDVLLLDGEQTMIAGLFVQEEQNIRSGIPFLKDLPGWFFGIKYLTGYNSTTTKNNELIIFIKVELMDKLVGRIAKRRKEVLGRSLKKNKLEARKDFLELKDYSDKVSKINNKEIYPKTQVQPVVKPQPQPELKPQLEPLAEETKKNIKKLTQQKSSITNDPVVKPVPKKKVTKVIKAKKVKKRIQKIVQQIKKVEKKVLKPQTSIPPNVEPIVDVKPAIKPIVTKKNIDAQKFDKKNIKPRYTIQLFSSNNYKKTLEKIDKYKVSGVDVYLEKQKVKGRLVYRVRSGRFAYYSEAKKQMQLFKQVMPDRKDMWIDNL